MTGESDNQYLAGRSLGRRVTQISRLQQEHFDVVVVGGGITGAGIALDAASRGLRTALVEKADFASGTSSRSSKLIHGGLRYLAQKQFRVTYHSLKERYLLSQLAPQMVEPAAFVLPIYGRRNGNAKIAAALWLYDLLAQTRSLGHHRWVTKEEVLGAFSELRRDDLAGGFAFKDCRTDDARLTMSVLKTAVDHGAVVVNYGEARGFPTAAGKVAGVDVSDAVREQDFTVRAHKVVVAGGVWLDQILGRQETDWTKHVRPAKGVHLFIAKEALPLTMPVYVQSPSDNRYVFIFPWQDVILVGTTDTPYDGTLANPRADRSDLDYLLEVINHAFPDVQVTERDVLGTQAGLRPLVDDHGNNTVALSREERIFETASGLIGVAGGKLTTYRQMAEKVVDLVLKRMVEERHLEQYGESRTKTLPLSYQSRRWTAPRVDNEVDHLANELGISAEIRHHLLRSFGGEALDILSLLQERPYQKRLIGNRPETTAEVVYATRHELAQRVEDVLARRTRLALVAYRETRALASDVAALMAPELEWSPAETARQVELGLAALSQYSPVPPAAAELTSGDPTDGELYVTETTVGNR